MMEINVKDGKVTRFALNVMCRKEDDAYIAFIPALDLATHGENIEDALEAAQTAAKAFIEQIIEMGTLEDVLSELGWDKAEDDGSEFPYTPPYLSMSTQMVSVRCPD